MSEIEKIKRYIQRTNLNEDSKYCIGYREVVALLNEMTGDTNEVLEAIAIAFNYGKAKGYRAAKAERKAVAK